MENQATVAAWSFEKFGRAATVARRLARADEEMAELLRAITSEAAKAKVIEEAADVVIVLLPIFEIWGENLLADLAEARARRAADGPDCRAPVVLAAEAGIALRQSLLGLHEGWPRQKPYIAAVMAARRAVDFLDRLVEALGGEIWAAVTAKMVINRRRDWSVGNDGCAYHLVKGAAHG